MGYLTHHTIKIEPFNFSVLQGILDELNANGNWFEINEEEINIEPFNFSVLQGILDELNANGNWFEINEEEINSEFIKWYDWDEDILELSKQFPTVTITMLTTGEDGEKDVFICRNGLQVTDNKPCDIEEIKELAEQSFNDCLEII